MPDAPRLSDDEVWRWFVTPFLHADQLGYAFVALVAVGIFGTLLERRFGPVAVVATFILAGAAGAGAVRAARDAAAALRRSRSGRCSAPTARRSGVLVAWLVDDRLAARRGDDRENDLLGVYVIAAVLVLLSLTTEEANISAAVGGALVGAVMGLLLPRLTRKA